LKTQAEGIGALRHGAHLKPKRPARPDKIHTSYRARVRRLVELRRSDKEERSRPRAKNTTGSSSLSDFMNKAYHQKKKKGEGRGKRDQMVSAEFLKKITSWSSRLTIGRESPVESETRKTRQGWNRLRIWNLVRALGDAKRPQKDNLWRKQYIGKKKKRWSRQCRTTVCTVTIQLSSSCTWYWPFKVLRR